MFGRSGRVLGRSRWMGIGAVAAVVLGSGGLLTASASGSPGASSFVPITPCRLLDTRPTELVGARNTPLGPGATFTTTAWGVNGNCIIPVGATALSMNVVAINGTSASYLTVFPADKPQPLSSSLNWVAGEPPTPNAVTVALSADGRLSFFNNSGSVDLAVDIVGYYEPAGGGTVGPAGPPGPQGATGATGAAGPSPLHVVWVAKSGGDFTSVAGALASITDNDLFHPYVIRIAPGVYVENGGIDLKDYVDIEGSGENTTTVLCSCSSETVPLLDGSSAVLRASGVNLHSELRHLAVANVAGNATYATAIWIGSVSGGVTLDHVTATSVAILGHFGYGVGIVSSTVKIGSLTASATGAGNTTGVFIVGSTSNVVIRDSSLRGAYSSITLLAPARAAAFDTVFNGVALGMYGRCFNAVDIGLAAYACPV